MEPNELVEKILKQGPSSGALADILSGMKEKGRFSEVVRTCIRFLPTYPDDVRLRAILADAYAAMGFIGMAETEFTRAGQMIDRLASVYRSLARIYETQGRCLEAAAALRRFVAHYPEDSEAIETLRRLESALEPVEVFGEQARASVEDLPQETEEAEEELVDLATPTIAELYYAQGRLDAAIQTYERVVRDHPEDQTSLARLNRLREEQSPPAKEEEIPLMAARSKEKRMIAILEQWLHGFQVLRHA